MTRDGGKFAKLLSAFLENLSDDDVAGLVRGDLRITIAKSKPRRRARKSERPDPESLRPVLEFLNSAETREAGFEKLNETMPTKAHLEALARLVDLPIQRSDTVEDLQRNIVEATIGYRLRSKAIQGRDK